MRISLVLAASLLSAAAIAAPAQRVLEHKSDLRTVSQVLSRTDEQLLAPVKPDAATVAQVKCNLIYDHNELTPLVFIYLKGSARTAEVLKHNVNSLDLYLMPGKYGMYVSFTKYNPALPDDSQYDFFTPATLVLKEVEVTGNMTIDFDASTAVNEVTYDVKTRNGESLVLPLYKDKKVDLSQGNVRSSWRSSSIFHPEYTEVFTNYGNDGYRMEDGRDGSHAFNFRINDISDDFTFVETVLTESTEYEMSLMALSHKGLPEAGTPVSNDPASFVAHTEFFVPTPQYDNLRHELYNSEIYSYSVVNGFLMVGYRYVSEKPVPTFYVSCVNDNNDDTDMSFLTTPKFFEEDYYVTGDQRRTQAAILGCPVASTEDGLFYENSFHDYFTIPVENMPGNMGNNTPVNALRTHVVSSSGKKVMKWEPQFVGRWGEIREADPRTITAEVKYNGEVKCSDWATIGDWAEEWASDSHTPGIVTATFTSDNTLIDNSVTGTNTVEVTYDESSYDLCAPVLQFLTVKNEDGVYTDRLADTQGASLEFIAGDFNGTGTYGSSQDVFQWTVEVAPHGTSNFKTVPSQVVRNMEGTQKWGVYTANISTVNEESESGWFDVRVTLSDFATAKSVQTIAPAFDVASLSGVAPAAAGGNPTITVKGSTITVAGAENPTVEVFATAGRCALRATGNTIDASALQPGIYVVKATTAAATVTAKIALQ